MTRTSSWPRAWNRKPGRVRWADVPASPQPPGATGRASGESDAQQAPETVTHTIPPRCRARTRLYRDGALAAEGFPATEIKQRMAQGHCAVWLDLYDPEIEDLAVLTEEFGLHPLAVEDAVHDHERPKLDRYHDHLLLSVYAAELDAPTGTLSTSELAAFITPAALITVRKDDRFEVDALIQRWDDEQDLARTASPSCSTGCSTCWSMRTSPPCSRSTPRSRTCRICCSPTPAWTPTCNGAASSCARAWSRYAESCCPCARCSTPSCAGTCTSSTPR